MSHTLHSENSSELRHCVLVMGTAVRGEREREAGRGRERRRKEREEEEENRNKKETAVIRRGDICIV